MTNPSEGWMKIKW